MQTAAEDLRSPTPETAPPPLSAAVSRVGVPLLAAGVAVVAAGLALRMWVLSSDLGHVDSDEAVGGLIARHFLDGEVTVFLWGNAYGGTIEALLTAPLFAVFGTGPVVLKSVMILIYAVACVLTWRIGLRTTGPAAARFAAALLWLGPAALVLISTKARMYYGAALVLTSAAILLCLRLASGRSKRDMALLGFVLGLGLWAAPFVFYVFIPVVGWLLISRPGRWLDVPLALPGALLGASPWLAFNLRNGWPSLHERPLPVDSTYPERVGDFFTELVPRLLGLETYWGEWVLGGAGGAVYAALAAGAIGFAAWCLSRRNGRCSRYVPLLVILAGYPFLFAIPKSSFYVKEPRYGLFLAPVVALLLAAGLTRVLRRPPLQLAALTLVTAGSAAGLGALVDWTAANPGHHDVRPPALDGLAAALDERGITTVVADYWIAYALVFETDERIIATPTGTVRYQPYQQRVDAAGATDYVFFPESGEDLAFESMLRNRRVSYVREVVAGNFALYRLDRPLRRP